MCCSAPSSVPRTVLGSLAFSYLPHTPVPAPPPPSVCILGGLDSISFPFSIFSPPLLLCPHCSLQLLLLFASLPSSEQSSCLSRLCCLSWGACPRPVSVGLSTRPTSGPPRLTLACTCCLDQRHPGCLTVHRAGRHIRPWTDGREHGQGQRLPSSLDTDQSALPILVPAVVWQACCMSCG